MKDVYIIAYQRADGRTLLVVGNLSREDRQGSVCIDAKRLGVRPDKVQSWPDKAGLPTRDGTVSLTVAGLGYRLLMVEK
jgi:hypothetical protein